MSTEALPERSEVEPDASDELREEIARAESKAEALSRANEALGGNLHVAPLANIGGREIARTAYREADPALRLEETLEEANARVVDLALENAVLADRKARLAVVRRVRWIRIAAAVATLSLPALVVVFGSASALGMILWFSCIGGLGAVVFVLSGRIVPNTDAPKQSPYTGAGR